MECSGADAEVCEEKLRYWKQKSSNCALLDLRDAYMQIGVVDECSKYQIVKFKGAYYKLRRLGFCLNCAPEIMKVVVSKVLSLGENIFKAIGHYYNDIIILFVCLPLLFLGIEVQHERQFGFMPST